MKFIKPEKLKKGDTVGIVSASWGGPSVFPHIYESGLLALEKLGLKIKEFPSARKDADFIYNNPEFRAKDINDAFADSEVRAIIASIGGDDSVRILPYLDTKKILENPKILMGYSDTSTLTTYLNQLGLVTFNSPSIMAGFSQWNSLESKFQKHISDFLFGNIEENIYPTFDYYANGYPDWSDKRNVGKIKETFKNDGCHWIQGNLVISGELYGGCIEIFGMLNGTKYWPNVDFWNDKIFFIETSEEKPSPDYVKYALRNYGIQGIFDKIKAILVGRARDYTEEEKKQLENNILDVVSREFNHSEMPIVTNMDFGHTDPQWILPLGIKAEVDPIKQTFKLLESPFK